MKKCPYCGFEFEEKLNNCPNCGREVVIPIQNYNPSDLLNIKKAKRNSFFNILGKIFIFLFAFLLNLFFIILSSDRVYNDKGYWTWVNNFLSKFEWLVPWALPIFITILLYLLMLFILKLKRYGYLNFKNKIDNSSTFEINSEETINKPIQAFNSSDPSTIQKLYKTAFFDNMIRTISIVLYFGIVVLMYFIFRNTIISDSSNSPLQTSTLLSVLNEWSLGIGLIFGLLLFAILLGGKKKK